MTEIQATEIEGLKGLVRELLDPEVFGLAIGETKGLYAPLDVAGVYKKFHLNA